MRLILITSILLCTSFTSAWPWPPSLREVENLLQRRQNGGEESTTAAPDTSILPDTNAPTSAATSDASAAASSDVPSETGTITDSAAASTTISGGSGSNTGPTKTGSGTVKETGKQTATKTTAAKTTDIDPRLPAGGISMLTPSALAPASYYKIGTSVTFGWNYTSLIVTPTAVDILVSCAANQATYTLANNQTVKETGSVVWDTSLDEGGEMPLLTDTYTLVIHDAAQAVTAIGQPGKLGTFSGFTFGMYLPQAYTPLANSFVCATCSGALSDMERQTLSFMFGMVMVTILSFTWFVGGLGVF